jgi:hypothetical protein
MACSCTPMAPAWRSRSDRIAFSVTERTRPEKHIPTEEERVLHDRQQAKRQRAADRQDWDLYTSIPYQEPWPKYDTVYTGQLMFQIEGWARGLRKTWADGKTQSIESMFEGIILGLKVIFAHEKTERERREEEAHQGADLARRHDLAKKRREREERRIAYDFPPAEGRWKHGTPVHLRIAITPRKPLTTLLAL